MMKNLGIQNNKCRKKDRLESLGHSKKFGQQTLRTFETPSIKRVLFNTKNSNELEKIGVGEIFTINKKHLRIRPKNFMPY